MGELEPVFIERTLSTFVLETRWLLRSPQTSSKGCTPRTQLHHWTIMLGCVSSTSLDYTGIAHSSPMAQAYAATTPQPTDSNLITSLPLTCWETTASTPTLSSPTRPSATRNTWGVNHILRITCCSSDLYVQPYR